MDEGNQVFRQADSAALLVIEFPSFRDFIDAYSPIISEEGIFIRNEDVSESNAFAVGDRVDFEVRLKDDFRLIQGAGEVVWLGHSEAAEGASGTAIRFRDLDEPSKRLISRLVGNYERDGGKLFEIGPATSKEEAASALEAEPEAPSELGPLPDPSQLTAENLEASEADELFAGESEEPAAPVEFESVSLEDVERGESEALGAVPDAERPVGLDTIAIPSGLIADLASEGQGSPEEGAVEAEAEALGAVPTQAEDVSEPLEPPLEAAELPPIAEVASAVAEPGPPESEASFSEIAPSEGLEPPESLEPMLEEDFGGTALEAAAVSLDEEFGGGGIPDDIAQVAEELSGVHRVELPDPEEASGVGYAGSASVGRERNVGGWIAALSVAVVLLGAGLFFFQDTILDYLGRRGEESASIVGSTNRAGGAVATRQAPPGAEPDLPEPVPSEAAPGAEGPQQPTAEAEGDGESDMAPELGPVEVIVERDSGSPDDGAGTEAEASPEDAAREEAAPAASAAPNRPAAPAAEAVARRVERITWVEEGGETIVSIRLSAEISSEQVEVVRVRDGAPREVIKIQGVEVPYSPREMAVGSRHVERLRTGLHQGASGSSLHVVADLSGAGVTVLSVEPKGRDLLITFS